VSNSGDNKIISTGIYNTPVGGTSAGPLFPGDKYEFIVKAKKGEYLSFASMFGESNDLFFAPSDMGIALWDKEYPTYGNVSSQISLWDDGTEVDEYPGAGSHQPSRGPGGTVENNNIMVVNDGFSYPLIPDMIKVTITPL